MFANPDGTWTSDTANEPERVQDDQGEWHNIDTSLVPVEGGFEPKHAIGDLIVSDGGEKRFASIESDGRDLGWSWPTSLPTPVIDGPSATYPNAVEGGDLVVTAVPTGFRHDIVLRERPSGPVSFAIPILTGGPKVSEKTSGEVSIDTRGGDELATATKPVMYSLEQPAGGSEESSTPVDPAELSAPEDAVTVDATVTSTATGGVLTLKPDTAFLTDPDTTYPVVIDPTVRIYPTGDTWVGSGTPNSIHPYDDTIKMGTPDGGSNRYRAFIRFAASTEDWYGQDVVSSKMYLRNFEAKKCGPAGQMNAHRVTTDVRWSELTWNNQPSATSTYMTSTTAAYGYSSACPSDDVSVDLTDVTQQWANGVANYGVRLSAATETYTPSYREFRSASYTTSGSTGLRPRLLVTYNRLPPPPDGANVKSNTTEPMVAAHLTGATSSSSVRMKAEVLASSGAVVKTYFSSFVPSGESIHVSLLELNPATYTVRVWAESDGRLSSSSTAAGTLEVGAGNGVAPAMGELGDSWTPATRELSAAPQGPIAFPVQLPVGYTATQDAGVVQVRDPQGAVIGSYFPMAMDYSEQVVPSSISLSEGQIQVIVNPSTSHGYPIMVGPVFEGTQQ